MMATFGPPLRSSSSVKLRPRSGCTPRTSIKLRVIAAEVTRILAEAGTDLPRGAPLIVLEAMKMEHTLRAPSNGRLKALKCAVGDFVQEGAELADFEPVAD